MIATPPAPAWSRTAPPRWWLVVDATWTGQPCPLGLDCVECVEDGSVHVAADGSTTWTPGGLR